MKAAYIALGVVGVGAIGFLVWKKMYGPQEGSYSVSPYSAPNNAFQNAYVGSQPSQQYPYTAIVPPRVDNSNQPWYGGTRQLASSQQTNLQSGMDLGFANTVDYVNGASTIIGSLRNIWDDLELGTVFAESSSSDSWDVGENFNWSDLGFV